MKLDLSRSSNLASTSLLRKALRYFVVLASVLACFSPRGVKADVLSSLELPKGYEQQQRGHVTWQFPPQAKAEAERLQAGHAAWWQAIEQDLGKQITDNMTVVIAVAPAAMRDLAPRDSPPPRYAAGVAYPQRGLILLSKTAPSDWKAPGIEALYRHELSHIALARAVGHRPVPRWFNEGFAAQRSGEYGFARFRILTAAAMARKLYPVANLSANFPDRPHAVSLAYAQSSSFVTYMRNSQADRIRFRRLIDEVSRGIEFKRAVQLSYHVTLGYLEREWLSNIDNRFRFIPIFISGSGIWLFVVVLLALAYMRRKKRERVVLERWAHEESEEQAAAVTAISIAPPLPKTPSNPPEFPVELRRPGARDTPVPTVNVDGKDHTLH